MTEAAETGGDGGMTLSRITRFPIKALGGEDLPGASLSPGCILPGDRAFAILHAAGARHLNADGGLDRWVPKSCFLRGVSAPQLQAVRAARQGDALRLTHPAASPFTFTDHRDGPALIDWLRPFWPDDQPAPLQLVAAPTPLTDMRDAYLSILSLTSLAALEKAAGQDFGMDRWRGNLWLSGLAPWAERELIGQHLQIGTARLIIRQRITRCHATSANTLTGERDGDMLARLQDLQGDTDFGLYAEVTEAGTISTGDQVRIVP